MVKQPNPATEPKQNSSSIKIIIPDNQAPLLPVTGYLRIWNVIGDRKRNIPALIPIGRTTFLNGVKSGKYPKPVKLGERTTAWKVEDIRALIESFGGAE
ncbi:MAG: AlpA family phage regulatory protein [Methylococcales bacterium]|nr:AlpA family phage regulatory protein [Methylococcales bacterium]